MIFVFYKVMSAFCKRNMGFYCDPAPCAMIYDFARDLFPAVGHHGQLSGGASAAELDGPYTQNIRRICASGDLPSGLPPARR